MRLNKFMIDVKLKCKREKYVKLFFSMVITCSFSIGYKQKLVKLTI